MTAGGGPHQQASLRPVVALTLINFAYMSAYMCYFPTLPQFIKDLGGEESAIGLLIGVSSLTAMASRPFIGYLVDRAGRKPLLILGLFLFCLNALLYNLPTSPAQVLPVRLVTGAGFATFLTASSTYVADLAPAERRGSILAYYGIASTLALAVGPTIGGFVIDSSFFHPFDQFFTSRIDWLSGTRTGEDNFTTLFLLTAAIAALCGVAAMFLPEPARAGGAARRLTLSSFVSRAAFLPASLNFTTTFVTSSVVTLLPIFAKEEIGLSNVGFFFMVNAVAVILSRVLLGRAMDRVARIYIIVPGVCLLVVSVVVMALATNVPVLFAAAGLYGFGSGTFQPALMAFAVDRAPAEERGRAMSTYTLGSDLGLSVGAFTLGVVADTSGTRLSFVAGSLVACIGLALFVAAWRRMQPAAEAPETPLPAAGT